VNTAIDVEKMPLVGRISLKEKIVNVGSFGH